MDKQMSNKNLRKQSFLLINITFTLILDITEKIKEKIKRKLKIS